MQRCSEAAQVHQAKAYVVIKYKKRPSLLHFYVVFVQKEYEA